MYWSSVTTSPDLLKLTPPDRNQLVQQQKRFLITSFSNGASPPAFTMTRVGPSITSYSVICTNCQVSKDLKPHLTTPWEIQW